MAATSKDIGEFPLGAFFFIDFTFAQNKIPTNPGVFPICNMTPPGGAKTPYTLSPTAEGKFRLSVSAVIPGRWTGTAYAPPGTGQAPLPFSFTVDDDPNYP